MVEKLHVREIWIDWNKVQPACADQNGFTYNTMESISGSRPIVANPGGVRHVWNLTIEFNPLRIVFDNGTTFMCNRLPSEPIYSKLLSLCNSGESYTLSVSYVYENGININVLIGADLVAKLEFYRCNRLIVSSGDISDIDGLYAIAKYAVTGADVLFVMNYPAYLEQQSDIGVQDPGFGYKYDTASFLKAFLDSKSPNEQTDAKYIKYMGILECYSDIHNISDRIKHILTDIAFHMVAGVWKDINLERKGRLYFCIGGINTINPFSKTSLKNEIYVYSDLISKSTDSCVTSNMKRLVSITEGTLFDLSGDVDEIQLFDRIRRHSEIFIDFNGSMAFFNANWIDALQKCRNVIRGAYVMGGVLSNKAPVTMCSIDGVLNRFSCATMNQLYCPIKTSSFFHCLSLWKIEIFVVTNNSVGTQETTDDSDPPKKTDVGWKRFLDANLKPGIFISGLHGGGSFLKSFANTFYGSQLTTPRRAFDFYTATALVNHMSKLEFGLPSSLYFDKTYGVVIVSLQNTWADAISEYSGNIVTDALEGELPFIRSKKLNFKAELDILQKIECDCVAVRSVSFMETDSGVLRVVLTAS